MYGVLAGIIITMGAAGYWYYTDTQATMQELRDLNAAYELKFSTQEDTIKALEHDFKTQTQALNDLQVASQEAQREMTRYLDIFKRHNLTKLAAAKPGLIETRVNKGTKNVFESIENDSRDIDSLDDGLQFAPEGTAGNTDTDKASVQGDSSASSS